MEMLAAFLFGFPGAFLSLLLSAFGIVKGKNVLVIIGAALFLPFTYYLYGSPGILSNFVILLPLLQFGSALAVFKKKRTQAWLLLTPSILIVLWVVSVVMIYSSGIADGV